MLRYNRAPVASAKTLYHRLIPEAVRNPIGLFRRRLADRIHRLREPLPLPPVSLLRQIQLTPWVREYLDVGRRSSASIRAAFARGGIESTTPAAILDFGCGSGRTLRHLRDTKWTLSGCDVDREAIEWTRTALPFADLRVNDPAPPLPWEAGSFDAAYAVSVFTHFDRVQQDHWMREMGRVVRPGGLLVITSMGRGVLPDYPHFPLSQILRALDEDGYAWVPSPGSFNANAAFHTAEGLARFAAPEFALIFSTAHGSDGYQDLTLLRRIV